MYNSGRHFTKLAISVGCVGKALLRRGWLLQDDEARITVRHSIFLVGKLPFRVAIWRPPRVCGF